MSALSFRVNSRALTVYAAIFLLSAATLTWEIALTRLFAITQFYHFAFLAVNLALLGFGVSGVALSLGRQRWLDASAAKPGARRRLLHRLEIMAGAFAATLVASYLLINALPFDSYAIAWDGRQVWLLLLYYLALLLPFFCAGAAVGLALAAEVAPVNRVYAANLLGSAAGALLAPLLIPVFQLPGLIFVTAAAGLLAAGLTRWPDRWPWRSTFYLIPTIILALLALAPPPAIQVRLSPYKGLPQALHYPGARIVAEADGPVARTTVIQSRGVRSLPGLSFQYRGPLPSQYGLLADGDDLSPVLDARQPLDWRFLDYLPESLAYRLRPDGPVLVIQPRGGLAIWQALGGQPGRRPVVAIEPDVQAVRELGRLLGSASAYAQPQVETIAGPPRNVLAADSRRYQVIHLALTRPFRPVTSGAYSLGETYGLTVEAFVAYYAHLSDEGVLVMSRWLQTPPSESARALALIISALVRRGISTPQDHIVAIRGVQVATFFVKLSPWTDAELQALRRMSSDQRFDLVLAPDLAADEINRYNVLPEPYYEDVFQALLTMPARQSYFDAYPFDISPPTDDHPFFYHFFKWAQTPVVLRTLGQTWQPFGGSGILVLVALLVLALAAAVVLILLPLLLRQLVAGAQGDPTPTLPLWRVVVYFGALGLGFLLVEIPLIQRFILFLGHPTLAFAVVLAAVLFWSGLGSLLAPRLSQGLALGLAIVVLVCYLLILSAVVRWGLGAPQTARLLLTFLLLAPLGLLLGMPFPLGLRWLAASAPTLIPWAWAINGFASVVAAVLAALLALQWGFNWVLALGIGCYALALAAVWLQPVSTVRSLFVRRPPEAQSAPHPD